MTDQCITIHLHREIASPDLPGVERNPGTRLEEPLHLRPGVGLQVGGVALAGVVEDLTQVEQNRLLAVDQSELAQTLRETFSNIIQSVSLNSV